LEKVEACIFDLDGVVVDTAKFHFLAWRKLAQELNIEFSEEDNEQLKGVSRMTSLDIILSIGNQNFDRETKEEMAKRKNAWYREYISAMSGEDVLPGVINFLDDLNSHNIKTALGSASKNAPFIVNNCGLDKYFKVIIDGNKITKAKPDPEIFLKAAKELKVEPEYCIVFEDAEAGVEAALNGGMRCIGVGTSARLSKADHVISGFQNMSVQKLFNFYNITSKSGS